MTTVSHGTSHFRSREDAIKYYRQQGETAEDINGKLREKSISFGPPEVGPGDTIWLDDDARYHVREMNFAELSELTRYVVDDALNGRKIGDDKDAIIRKGGTDDFSYRSAFAIFPVPTREDQFIIIAVNSYLDVYLDDEEVTEFASDYMTEILGRADTPRIMRG